MGLRGVPCLAQDFAFLICHSWQHMQSFLPYSLLDGLE
jgi:hypothetical protein